MNKITYYTAILALLFCNGLFLLKGATISSQGFPEGWHATVSEDKENVAFFIFREGFGGLKVMGKPNGNLPDEDLMVAHIDSIKQHISERFQFEVLGPPVRREFDGLTYYQQLILAHPKNSGDEAPVQYALFSAGSTGTIWFEGQIYVLKEHEQYLQQSPSEKAESLFLQLLSSVNFVSE